MSSSKRDRQSVHVEVDAFAGFIRSHTAFKATKRLSSTSKAIGEMFDYLIGIAVFVLGLSVGSFMNVCIFRLPASKSVIHPRSMCPHCGAVIRYYDNIPLVSYLLLNRRCRRCNWLIPFRYPMIELMGGFFALGVFFKFGPTLDAFIYYVFITALLVITFIDIDHQIIPDLITLPAIPLGFLASFAVSALTYKESILGVLAGGGSLFIVAWTYNLVTHKEGMGGGDIKLLAMIGALVGWKGVLFTIFIASAAGALAGIAVMLHRHGDLKLAVPFGPFLAVGAISYVFWGSELISWYFNLLR